MNGSINNLNRKRNVDELNFENGIEIISKRGRREKHFLQKDGSIIAKVFLDDIHYLDNGKYIEIDNSLVEDKTFFKNKSNKFEVFFNKKCKEKIIKFRYGKHFVEFSLKNSTDVPIKIKNNNIDSSQIIKYDNILNGVSLEYNLSSNGIKEKIIFDNSNSIEQIVSFTLRTDLEVKIEKNNIVFFENDEVLFCIKAPFIYDKQYKIYEYVKYELNKSMKFRTKGIYDLNLILDIESIKKSNIKYPMVIDPTITINDSSEIQDTYISSNLPEGIYDDFSFLNAGVSNNSVYRALIKFSLPSIGTGYHIYQSILRLTNWPLANAAPEAILADVHRITVPWNESQVNWNNMYQNFDNRIEASNTCLGSILYDNDTILPIYTDFDITSLVNDWYTNIPNYGVLIKQHNENHVSANYPMFFSSNSSYQDLNLKPMLIIRYRNQNGIEEYMNCQSQSFTDGMVYENTFNGNLVAKFGLEINIDKKLFSNLNLVYSTNDVVLNKNYGCGRGFKFNMYQTLKRVNIDNVNYIEYMDDDGTLHYFYESNSSLYVNEENENIYIVLKNNSYYLYDEKGNYMIFTIVNGIGYLSEINGFSGEKIIINYNANNQISSIINRNNEHIILTYQNSCITINYGNILTNINYINDKVSSISTPKGSTLFQYNNEGLISKVTDINGTSVSYEYYNNYPYKAKKVTEYGTNNVEGSSFTMNYGNNVTMIKDNKDHITSLNFNSYGRIINTNSLASDNNIDQAYSISNELKNTDIINENLYSGKLLSRKTPIKYIKNYISNGGFEEDALLFHSTDASLSISDDTAYDGDRSLKIVSNTVDNVVVGELVVPKGEYYTLSLYIKNTNNMEISLSYIDVNNQLVEEKSELIESSSSFYRYDVTINYPNNAISNLFVNFYMINEGTSYIDNIQLEKGQVANSYNYIDNSDFSSGINDWNPIGGTNIASNFEIANIGNGKTALKINMDPENSTQVSKIIKINGKKSDQYTISFWYKNNGIVPGMYNSAIIGFNYVEEVEPYDIEPINLNPSKNQWQFFSKTYEAMGDYDNITISLLQQIDANELFITNVSLLKNVKNDRYVYNDDGNIKNEYEINKLVSQFNYDKDGNVTNIINSKNNSIFIEYDNNVKDKPLKSFSGEGLSNELKFDDNGNMIAAHVKNVSQFNEINDGLYSIRLKGTNKYLSLISNLLDFSDTLGFNSAWVVEKRGKYYCIHSKIIKDKYISFRNNSFVISYFDYNYSLFELYKNDNGSFSIKLKDKSIFLSFSNSKISFETNCIGKASCELYFEGHDFKYFIETTNEYSPNNNFIKSSTNTVFGSSQYDYDSDTNQIVSEIDELGNVTNYFYDSNNRPKKIRKGNKEVTYYYNENNKVSSIDTGNAVYNFEYDQFLNLSKVKIGDNITLIEHTYEDYNGYLCESLYGNSDYLRYKYDDFSRINEVITMDDNYLFKYGNDGNLLKIISQRYIMKYLYDIRNRLIEYRKNNYRMNYSYDSNNNIIENCFKCGTFERKISHDFDNDDVNIKTSINQNAINYDYDKLRRLTKCSINDDYIVKYKYVNNGNRASLLVKEKIFPHVKYSYKYDKMNNLTHIYIDEKLAYKYKYDCYEQLIREDDYLLGLTIKYKYDYNGNLISRNSFAINTNNLISQSKYRYDNPRWRDQLTNYNNKSILYDEIGNVTKIGNDISLTWSNGRLLYGYNDVSKNINVEYKYSYNNLRDSKNVNGLNIEYFYDNDGDLIFEKRGLNTLFYINNNADGLVGFYYNDQLYYYVKNLQDDIIALIDSSYNIVAKYEYDSFGKIISVLDANNNDVSDNENHIANINPFRYRSYYYDQESNLYYLKDRYYNPEWGRYINADTYISTDTGVLGYNMYLYCNNNYINLSDQDGKFIGIIVTAAKILAVACCVYAIVKTVKKGVNNTSRKKKEAKKAIKEVQQKNKNAPSIDSKFNAKLHNDAALIKTQHQFLDSNPLAELLAFISEVKTGGIYDLKRQPEWQETSTYNGIVMEAQDIGNFHFGYIGRAAGFSTSFLVFGAGLYQLYEHGESTIDNCISESFCDDMRDTMFIKMGAMKYDSEHPTELLLPRFPFS